MTDQKPSPEPEYTPPDDAGNARSFTVEVGRIDPDAVPLSEILKLGPNAGLLADLVDSLCAGPDDEVDLGVTATDEDRLRFSIMESRQAGIRQSRSAGPDPEGSKMTPQNLQAAFPAATGRDEDTGWIIDRRFLSDVTERVWRAGSRVSVTSVDVQTILLAAIELASVDPAMTGPPPTA